MAAHGLAIFQAIGARVRIQVGNATKEARMRVLLARRHGHARHARRHQQRRHDRHSAHLCNHNGTHRQQHTEESTETEEKSVSASLFVAVNWQLQRAKGFLSRAFSRTASGQTRKRESGLSGLSGVTAE